MKKNKIVTTYFSWDGDACRLHVAANGDSTADLYRAGKGLLPIDPTDLLFGAKGISESMYQDLVAAENRLRGATAIKGR